MLKKKLITSVALAMCLMTLSTGRTVFAEETKRGEIYDVTAEEGNYDEALEKKVADLNHYLFVDHVDEIKALGFDVVNLGIVDDNIEIGIVPFSEEAANYLYEKLGKEDIQIVEGIAVAVYATDVEQESDATPAKASVENESGGETVSYEGVVNDEGAEAKAYVGEGVVPEEGEVGVTAIRQDITNEVINIDEDLSTEEDDLTQDAVAEILTSGTTAETVKASEVALIATMTSQENETKEEGNSNLRTAIVAGGVAILAGGITFFGRKRIMKKR